MNLYTKDHLLENKIVYFQPQQGYRSGIEPIILAAQANYNDKSILDLGSGCGPISLILAHRFPNAEIVGLENNTFHLEYILDVDSPSEVIANGKLSNWTSPKTLKIKLKCAYVSHWSYGSSASSFYTHILKFWADSYDDYNNYYGVVSSENEKIIKPNLIIQAIGDESGSSDTKFGQTLEVISGVCDGRIVYGSEGGISYTLENVAAYDSLPDSSIYYFENFYNNSFMRYLLILA